VRVTTRLVLAIWVTALAVVASFAYLQVSDERQRLRQELERRASLLGEGLHDGVETALSRNSRPALERLLKRFGRSGQRLAVYDTKASLVALAPESFVPRPEVSTGNSKIGIIGYGTSHWGLIESRDQLRQEYNIETDYLRLRAYPFTREVHDFVKQHDRVYVVEQNRDAQMLTLLKLDLEPALITGLRSIAHIHGLPLDARSVTDELMTMEGK